MYNRLYKALAGYSGGGEHHEHRLNGSFPWKHRVHHVPFKFSTKCFEFKMMQDSSSSSPRTTLIISQHYSIKIKKVFSRHVSRMFSPSRCSDHNLQATSALQQQIAHETCAHGFHCQFKVVPTKQCECGNRFHTQCLSLSFEDAEIQVDSHVNMDQWNLDSVEDLEVEDLEEYLEEYLENVDDLKSSTTSSLKRCRWFQIIDMLNNRQILPNRNCSTLAIPWCFYKISRAFERALLARFCKRALLAKSCSCSKKTSSPKFKSLQNEK